MKLGQDKLVQLYERFAWQDVVTAENVCKGHGWSQSLQVSPDQLAIVSESRPNILGIGTHGLHVKSIDDETCLFTRLYLDGRQVEFTVAANLDHIVDIALSTISNKAGVAADEVIDKLGRDGLITLIQEIASA